LKRPFPAFLLGRNAAFSVTGEISPKINAAPMQRIGKNLSLLGKSNQKKL
jgi:hypothetical protein